MTDQDDQLDDSAPFTSSPDLGKGNGFCRMLGRVRSQRSLLPLKNYVLVPAPPPGGFAAKSLAEVHESLKTVDVGAAKATLAEAEATFQEPQDRIDSAERRATTLQGTVAIAAAVVTAGAGLLLDPTKVAGQGWRAALALAFGLFVFCLVACAVRALGATSRIFQLPNPGPQRIVDRAAMSESDALTHRAAELLRSADVADVVGAVKVGLLTSAAWWFRAALLMLGVLIALIAGYVFAGPNALAKKPAPVASQPRADGRHSGGAWRGAGRQVPGVQPDKPLGTTPGQATTPNSLGGNR